MRNLLRKLARLGLLQQVVKDLFYPEFTIRQLAGMYCNWKRKAA